MILLCSLRVQSRCVYQELEKNEKKNWFVGTFDIFRTVDNWFKSSIIIFDTTFFSQKSR